MTKQFKTEPTAIVAIKTNPIENVGTMDIVSKDSEGLTLGFVKEKEVEFYTEQDFQTTDGTEVSLNSVYDSIELGPVEEGQTLEFEKLYTLEQAKALLEEMGFNITKKG